MKHVRKIMIVLLAAAMLFASASTALGEDGRVRYVGGSEKFIFGPGSEYSPSDLFGNFKNVLPGDVLSQRINIRNDRKNDVKVRLYLRSVGSREDREGFLSQLVLSVTQKDGSTLFDAPLDQTAELSDWAYLGTLYSGGETELELTLTVPTSMDDRYQEAVGSITWEFMAEELPIEEDDPKPPVTADRSETELYAALMILSACLLAIALMKKKRSAA